MKTFPYYLTILAFAVLGTGCGKDSDSLPEGGRNSGDGQQAVVPEGYFAASFNMGGGTRSLDPTIGPDSRVQHIRYLIFNETGGFVKEREVLQPADGTPEWPLDTTLRDTLPNGNYMVVFLGNVDESLFPGLTNTLLGGYETGYANTRIELPSIGLTSATEYYMGKAEFSDGAPEPEIWLQRIIGGAVLHRNVIDAQAALDSLIANIFDNIDYNDIIASQLDGVLSDQLLAGLGGLGDGLGIVERTLLEFLGGVDFIVGLLVQPLAEVLLEPLLSQLVHQLGGLLTGNTDHDSVLSAVGMLVNPWALADADMAVVTIADFPNQIDLDLNIMDMYEGSNQFAIDFEEFEFLDQREVFIRGFGEPDLDGSSWHIQGVNVVKIGLVAGLVVDGVADGLLLNGALADITDQVHMPVGPNIGFRSNYSLLDLGLKDYTPQDGDEPLDVAVKLGDVANLNDALLGKIPGLGTTLDALLDPVFGLLNEITISLPVNVPLLGIDNLTLSGSWGTPQPL